MQETYIKGQGSMLEQAHALIAAELARLDLLLHRQILRLRTTYQLSQDEFHGLYISDKQVDLLINQQVSKTSASPAADELGEQAEKMRQRNKDTYSDDLAWNSIIRTFGLSSFEQDVLLLALAPHVDQKYETLYAYLNNDVIRKYPTNDLALRLFSLDQAQKISLRRFLLPDALLFNSGLLQMLHSPSASVSWLSDGFLMNPALTQFLLGFPFYNPAATMYLECKTPEIWWDEVPVSAELRAVLRRTARLFEKSVLDRPFPILILEGSYGTGRSLCAEALCKDIGIPLVRLDVEAICAGSVSLNRVAQELLLQQRLQRIGIYLAGGESLLNKEGRVTVESYRFLNMLSRVQGPVFLPCARGTRWHDLVKGQHFLVFQFDDPGYIERSRLWRTYLTKAGCATPPPIIDTLASRFRLAPGQIRDAVSAAIDTTMTTGDEASREVSFENLAQAAYSQSDWELSELAVKVETIHTWDDLVLSPSPFMQVRDVAAAIKNRDLVYRQWGFERLVSTGKGLKVLFTGDPGTGKTMAAGVIARGLTLPLYKIDLSGVVSKYIGETEKNLDRVFKAAHNSNALLLFDEADALFGKRSIVKDAHDRYANLEVAYLLQKMEEHEGVVVLASNLSRNIDEAFLRRMHYVIDFPMPDEMQRERLWRGMFPPEAPLGKDVDFSFLARQFAIAGGDIKNVVLDAAFLAAQDGQVVTMNQLIEALARQIMKQGKLLSAKDFKQYYDRIASHEREGM